MLIFQGISNILTFCTSKNTQKKASPRLLLFSQSVVSYSLQPHGLHHAMFLCPSLSPRVCSNSCPLSWWYHPRVSSSVAPFSSCLQSLPASGSFPMSQFFVSGDQNTGVSASASVLPMNIQGWFHLGLTDLTSLQSKGPSRFFSSTTVRKHQFFGTQPFLWSNSHICTWLLKKPQFWLYRLLSAKWCLCFLICCLGLSLRLVELFKTIDAFTMEH